MKCVGNCAESLTQKNDKHLAHREFFIFVFVESLLLMLVNHQRQDSKRRTTEIVKS
ncbi:hypothetical protein MADA3029_740091 [Vibrio nigripulchritudo MADA3029]|nr:hypothetical protein VIBNIMADA3021_510093 [Vibrio nigripulchritudo MADA3021]CCN61240.1 hypothetical protein MADA3029_740091 [Vibrio nigripulchritudo MADA3029]